MADPKPCPFCGNPPRYMPAKPGFHSERVICDHCQFYLRPQAWERRDGVMACDEPTSPAVQKATAIFHITRAELNLQADALHLVRVHLKAARDALRNGGVAPSQAKPCCGFPVAGPCPDCPDASGESLQ